MLAQHITATWLAAGYVLGSCLTDIMGTDTLPCVLRSLADHFTKSGLLTTRADGQSWKLDLRAGYKVFFSD